MSRKAIAAALAFVLVAAVLIYNSDAMKESRFVKALVARNIEARGGESAWENVSSLRLSGQMDLGQEMVVPYVLEQKRPDKMCFEFIFQGETSTQCANGESGWKIAPFLGREGAEAMTDMEFRETADSTDPYGLLYNYGARGSDVELVGQETIDGRDTFKLQVTLPKGGIRWLYLDTETALEVRLEAIRIVAGRERLVKTSYYNWQETDGLLISRRQETLTDGDTQSHFLTVESVVVNPQLDDTQFAMPTSAVNDRGVTQQASL